MKRKKQAPDDFIESVGANIKKIRVRNGHTQLYVSDRAEISIGNYSDIERGNQNPTLYTLKKIADALEVSISSFFRGL